jgi:RNA polymerase sigma factor (sigma-70 family)
MNALADPPPSGGVERAFLSALPEIEQAVRISARRARLTADEADDLASDVKLRLIEKDYAAFRRFDGRSQLRTYVVTIVERLIVDRHRREWGRFRPSADAVARGPVAERMERLLYSDGLPIEEAVAVLTAGSGDDRESLMQLAQSLPVRPVRRPVPEDTLAPLAAPPAFNPEQAVAAVTTSVRANGVIAHALGRMPPIDRIVLRMHFEDGISVADVARMLRLDQKRLYRRIGELLRGLREDFEREGLEWQDVREMVERGECPIRLLFEGVSEKPLAEPSHEKAHR